MALNIGGSVDAAADATRGSGDTAYQIPQLGTGLHHPNEDDGAHWVDLARGAGRVEHSATDTSEPNKAVEDARAAMEAWADTHVEVSANNQVGPMRQEEQGVGPAIPAERFPAVGGANRTIEADRSPPENLSQELEISSKFHEYGTAEMRQRLDNVNRVMREQYALLQPEVDRGHLSKASLEQRITAANAGAAINHLHDAVASFRQSVSKASSQHELDEAITKYGIQSSMIGGSLGKTVMSARTLKVRQQSLRIAGYSLATAGVSSVLAAAAIGLTAASQRNGNNPPSNSGSQGNSSQS